VIKELVIKPNNVGCNGQCPFCGARNDPRIPYDIFPVDLLEPVCGRCAENYAPDLNKTLDTWYYWEELMYHSHIQVWRLVGPALPIYKKFGDEFEDDDE
jgi:hypothetical protein